ncbi:MAG TPA: OmpA family protein [Polyangiaceae bacterium]|nr:OmpA family protein [Polyangiaceae bacterium]
MISRRRTALAAFGLPALVAASAVERAAHAQAQPSFALDRYNPAERGSEWFVLDSLDLRGKIRGGAGATLDYAWRPETYGTTFDSTKIRAVTDQAFVHVGGSLVFLDRFRVGFNLPLDWLNLGNGGYVGNVLFRGPDGGGLGDLRLGADIRLVGVYGDPFTAAIGAQLFLPTGKQSNYLSDGQVRGMPRLSVAGDVGPFVYAAMVGVQFRPHTGAPFGGAHGDELAFGASAGVRVVDGRLVLGPEFYGSTALDLAESETTPLEVILNAHFKVTDAIRVAVGGGPGINAAFGAPVYRLLASLEWFSSAESPPPPDRDGDGIPDDKDACPDTPGVGSSDPATNGCPQVVPVADRDHDGVPDDKDACPDTPGVSTDDPKTNGCPPPPPAAPPPAPPPKDTDGDGIPDDKDACPDQPGPSNPDPSKNGCPAARVVGSTIEITDQIHFKTGSAEILADSETTLQAVLTIVKDHPEFAKIRIEGHTDNVGAKAMNQTLSGKRANSVKAWLVSHGIAPGRLEAQGFGDSKPIVPNDTDQGRAANRRVEFHIESK